MTGNSTKETNVIHKTGNLGIRVYKTFGVQCHWHDEYEFIIPQTKMCDCIVNSQSIKVYPGQALLVYPGELHAVGNNGEAFYAIVFHPFAISGDELKSYVYPHVEYNRLYDGTHQNCREITDTLNEIVTVFDGREQGYELMLKSLIVKTASLIVKNGLYSNVKSVEHKQNIFFDILTYVNGHLNEKLTLETVSEQVNISTSYVSRLFKTYAGCTFCTYVTEARLEMAKKALTQCDKSVLEISLECGFDNVSYFISRFKKKWGCTPYSYRKSLQM